MTTASHPASPAGPPANVKAPASDDGDRRASVWSRYRAANGAFDIAFQASEGAEDDSPEAEAAEVAFVVLNSAIAAVIAAPAPNLTATWAKLSLFLHHTVDSNDRRQLNAPITGLNWEDGAAASLLRDMENLSGGLFHLRADMPEETTTLEYVTVRHRTGRDITDLCRAQGLLPA